MGHAGPVEESERREHLGHKRGRRGLREPVRAALRKQLEEVFLRPREDNEEAVSAVHDVDHVHHIGVL